MAQAGAPSSWACLRAGVLHLCHAVRRHLLNKPYKNYVARRHMAWTMNEVRQQLAAGKGIHDVPFSDLARACAGPVLGCMVTAYEQLSKVDLARGLQSIGYTPCFEEDLCRLLWSERASCCWSSCRRH
jgi:hypothetical protein